MYPPDGGQLLLAGRRLDGLPPERVVGQALARSFQITNLFPSLTVFENLRLGIQARHPRRFDLGRPFPSLAAVHEETQALVRFLGLEGVEGAPVASLSYGGQRLLELGLALAARPRGLLLDEALAGRGSRWRGWPPPSGSASRPWSAGSASTWRCWWSSTTSTASSPSPTASR